MSDVGEGGVPEKKFILFWASGTGPVSRICAMGVDFLSDFGPCNFSRLEEDEVGCFVGNRRQWMFPHVKRFFFLSFFFSGGGGRGNVCLRSIFTNSRP